MSLNPDVGTALVPQFRGSAPSQDAYDIDPSHLAYCQNLDFILGENESVQCATRRGTSVVATPATGDGSFLSLVGWNFVSSGIQDTYVVYYSSAGGVKFWDIFGASFGTILATAGASYAVFAFDGLRLYFALTSAGGKTGFSQGHVFGVVGNLIDTLFAPPLQTSVVGLSAAQGSAGVVTAGVHRIAFQFTTKLGYTGALNPVTSGGIFSPISYTAADGAHSCNVTFSWVGPPPANLATIQVVMTTAANLSKYYLVPAASVAVSGGTQVIAVNISDGDLTATGTDVTQAQNLLTQDQSGHGPFSPSSLFTFSNRMGYVAIDPSGFPVVYFSDQNSYQSLTAGFHGVYIEGRRQPVHGQSLGGTCYIATLTDLYSCEDNGGQPVTWTPPKRVDGSVGILSPSCMIARGGRLLIASEKGLYVYRGGVFPQIPLSYWQTSDWDRINWAAPTQVQIVDDKTDLVIRVLAPLSVVITGVSNTNPIQVTTGVLINGNPVAAPHLFQSGLSVTIAGVGGTTNANGTWAITRTSENTFTIPAIGNGAYAGGGTAVPQSPNAIMTWAYPEGDEPGKTFYSLHAFLSFRASAIGTVRNLATAQDETWFGPTVTNPGRILRRVLTTDPLPWRDYDLSGAPAGIDAFGETSLLPGSQDESILLHDNHGAHFRVSGQGSLALAVYGLDHTLSVIPTISPIALAQLPGKEILAKWFLRSEQASIQFGTSSVDAYFVLALIRNYWTNSLPMR